MVGVIGIVLDDPLLVLLHHQIVQVVVKHLEIIQITADGAAVLELGCEPGVADGKLLDLLVLKQLPQLGVADGAGAAHARHQVVYEACSQQQEQRGPPAEFSLGSQ